MEQHQDSIPHLLKAGDIEAMPATVKVHGLNPQELRSWN